MKQGASSLILKYLLKHLKKIKLFHIIMELPKHIC